MPSLAYVNPATQKLETAWLGEEQVAVVTVRIFKRYGDALLPDPSGAEYQVPLDLLSSPGAGYKIGDRVLVPVEAAS